MKAQAIKDFTLLEIFENYFKFHSPKGKGLQVHMTQFNLVQALARVIVLCSWARHFALIP